jgi:MotA/TolQ/ExbB proton channel family protein
MHEPPSQSGAFIAKLGAWLQLAHLISFVGAFVGMTKAFRELATSGTSDPPKLSAVIKEVLQKAFAGSAVALVGLILVTISITVCRYRAVWMFWFLCIYGILLAGGFFPFGLFFLIFALVKKDEFLRPQALALAV